MRFLRRRILSVLMLGCIGLLFIGLLAMVRLYSLNIDVYLEPSSIILGRYSIDDGPWVETDLNVPLEEHFHKIVFKGSLIPIGHYLNELDVSFKNVWFTLEDTDGELIYSNRYRDKDNEAWNYADQETIDFNMEYMPMAMRMPHTPGYEHVTFIPEKDFPEAEDKELVLTVEYPYPSSHAFSECVIFTLSQGNGAYLRASKETLLPSMFFLLVCFFGIFLFPMISFIFGQINYRYLSFGFLCFFWGVFMLMHFQSWYLNHYILDPVLCMMLERMTLYFFFVSLLLYFRGNLKRTLSRGISGITALVFLLAFLAAVILHLAGVSDLAAATPYINSLMGVSLLVHAVLLTLEARTDKNTLLHLLSWIPMLLGLLIDLIRNALGGADAALIGFGLTLMVQIVQLAFDLQRQYKEAVRYQLIQRELYEARVSIMTSQIRPHFMYNALTSIAMMCTIDPPTAQEATITFAKYLRENMDSLKQNKPVPFAQEFDHLKKYLYIEKLRFQDKLQIEYDVVVTDFVLPLLTVQPLVENAVKHGVGMKKKGGTVKIATRETDSSYEVIISDDGVGFDPSAPKADDGRSHVGMENTRARLRQMCKGEIRIESTPGEGTAATIILPKEGQKDYEDIVSG